VTQRNVTDNTQNSENNIVWYQIANIYHIIFARPITISKTTATIQPLHVA